MSARPPWRRGVLRAAALLAAVNLALYLTFTLPKSLQERSIAQRVAVVRTEVLRERQRVDALRQRSDTLRRNAQDTRTFRNDLGTKASVLTLRDEIASAASQLGLKVGSRAYAFEPIKGADDLMRFEMRMPVGGTYAQLAAFLDRLERSPHFVTVDQIQLQQREPGQRAELAIVLSSFYRVGGGPDAPSAGGET